MYYSGISVHSIYTRLRFAIFEYITRYTITVYSLLEYSCNRSDGRSLGQVSVSPRVTRTPPEGRALTLVSRAPTPPHTRAYRALVTWWRNRPLV